MIVTLCSEVCIDLVELFNIHSAYHFSLYCTMLRFVTMISLNEDTYIGAYNTPKAETNSDELEELVEDSIGHLRALSPRLMMMRMK